MSTPHLPEVEVGALWAALEQAADLAGLGVFVARLDSTPPQVVYASRLAAQIVGRGTSQDLVGIAPWEILRPEDQAAIIAMASRPVGAPPAAAEVHVLRPDGTLIPVALTTTRMITASALLTFGYFRDLTEEHAARAALARSEARFQFLLEHAPDGVAVIRRGTIVFINPKAAELLASARPDQLLGRSIVEFLPPEDGRLALARLEEIIRTGEDVLPNEYQVLVPGRTVEIKSVPLEWEGEPAVMAFARDVTERKAIEARLVEADRLAALGTLAAAVAHEINNPLTYAQLTVQGISRALAAGVPVENVGQIREQLRDIEHGISRIASITAGLRSFARTDDTVPGPVDLVPVIERALKMVDNDLRHRAQLVKWLGPVPPVTGTMGKLEQVIVNVLLNAIQSLPATATTPGTIEVTVAPRDAKFVALRIRDSGPGISAEVRARIFEPFFTTRPVGESMGLGLAVSKTIIDSFGGEISIDSVAGAGTTVTIALPIHESVPVPAPEEPADPIDEGRHRVLVIDDEPMVRNILAKLLADTHAVTVAGSGADGIALLATMVFDVIICDVMMPGMNGREVHRRVAEAHPGMERRMVFISGGAFAPELEKFLESIPNPKLAKPFRLDDVLKVVEQVAKST
ncbi:MAG: PAS domain S-box protein [Kofleriaceae bacterium]|nr:PAS domain S-box protein [Kofleriaceae bacterium]